MDIVLADDHALVREGMLPFLKRLDAGATILEAATLPEALRHASGADDLRLIILDLYMPGMNGLGGLCTMRQSFPEVPLAVMSGCAMPDEAIAAIEHGADGFLPKTMSANALTGALQVMLAGERYVPSFLLSASAPPPFGRRDRVLENLSPREHEIALMVARGAPNKVIARQLGLHEVTVKAHLRNVFKKLGATNRTEVARTVYLGTMRPTGT